MKKLFPLLFLFLMLCYPALPVQAHAADRYSHFIFINLSAEGVKIRWEMKSGPLIGVWLWNQADTNQDGTVSQAEADAWGASQAAFLSASVDGKTLPLKLEQVVFPGNVSEMQSGAGYPILTFSAVWPAQMGASAAFSLVNTLDEINSLNWFGITAGAGAAFQAPLQKTNTLNFSLVRASLPGSLNTWDSDIPTLASNSSTGSSPQEMLVGLVKQDQSSLAFFLFALAVSFGLGALHALTPGHGKTVVAAYLVGERGTAWHAVLLGSVVTITHTGSVLLLGLLTLLASRYILSNSLIPVMEVLSGLLIIGLGVVLLVGRLRDWRQARAHGHSHAGEHVHEHTHDGHSLHDHEHSHEHTHGNVHDHTHTPPEKINPRSLIALGVSGGLVPCPDAIAILLVAIAINRILLGLALIVSFSLGLAVVLISIGLVMVNSRRLFDRLDAFRGLAPLMPLASAVVVLVLGAVLVINSAGQALAGFTLPVSVPPEKRQVYYLANDENGRKQINLANLAGTQRRALTSAAQGVTDYALAPTGSQFVYFQSGANSETTIWLMNADGSSARQAAVCAGAVCQGPVWSPDGRSVIYTSTGLGSGNLAGIPTLWILDVQSAQARPLFQDSNLPVTNPRWSPDGAWLSYATPEGVRLFGMGSGEDRLIGNRIGSEAVWSGDSQSLYFRENIPFGNSLITQVLRYDLSTRQLSPFNPDPAADVLLLALSPDGKQAALVQRATAPPNSIQIWLASLDGSQKHDLTAPSRAVYTNLGWSPDGKFLLVDVFEPGQTGTDPHSQVIDASTGQVYDLGPGSNLTWKPGS